MLHIPHDCPLQAMDRSGKPTLYPSPPVYGLACDFAAWVRRLVRDTRHGASGEKGVSSGGDGERHGLLPPYRCF